MDAIRKTAPWVFPFFLLLLLKIYRDRRFGKCQSKTSLTGRVFVITGANRGVGRETAAALAARGATVVLACRSIQSACFAIRDIRNAVAFGELVPMELNLASFTSIRKFAASLLEKYSKIHVLINNAGVCYPVEGTDRTEEGFELNFGVNYLGHFLLTKLLLERIAGSEPSRIVIVSSGQHQKGKINLDDFNLNEKHSGITETYNSKYATSKLCNVYHCRQLAEVLRQTKVQVFAVTPGLSGTGLFRHFPWWQYAFLFPAALLSRTPLQGAQTILHCATEEDVGKSGEFFRNCKVYQSSVNFDPVIQKLLWEKSENIITHN